MDESSQPFLERRETPDRRQTSDGSEVFEERRKEQERRGTLEPLNIDVLFAEDREDVRTIIKRILESLGCTVTAVINGKELVNTAKQRKFGLVLTDIDMPEMGGLEALHEIRKDSDVPVIVYTGYPTDERFQMVQATQRAFLLPKPFNRNVLHAAIKGAIAEPSQTSR